MAAILVLGILPLHDWSTTEHSGMQQRKTDLGLNTIFEQRNVGARIELRRSFEVVEQSSKALDGLHVSNPIE